MKILQITNRCPFPPKDGYCIAVHSITRGIVLGGEEVTLLYMNTSRHFTNAGALSPEYSSLCEQHSEYVDNSIKPIAAFLNLFSRNSYNISRFYSEKFEKKLIWVLKQKKFEIVQLEGLPLCLYVDVIRKHSNAKIILRAHNIEYKIWELLAANEKNPIKKWYLNLLTERLRKFERSQFERVDAIIPITYEDARSISEFSGSTPVAVHPAGLLLSDYRMALQRPNGSSLFHIGALNWMPNIEGLKWFLDEVWPGVHKKYPELYFHIAGRYTPPNFMSLNRPQVTIHGEVEDAIGFLTGHSIMVVPLLSGSGMRVKIIEAMAMGKTVISTAIGAEGIECTNGKNILLANTATEFTDAISRCLSDPPVAALLGRNARLLVEEKYNNEKLTGGLLAFYRFMSLRV